MELIDSHCHLDDDRYDAVREVVIADAAAAGVRRMIVPATTANRWDKIRTLCADAPGLFPAYGLHPWFVEQHQLGHLRDLDEWLAREQPNQLGLANRNEVRPTPVGRIGADLLVRLRR